MKIRTIALASVLGVLSLGASPAQASDGCRPRSGFSIRIGYNVPRYVVRTYSHHRDYGRDHGHRSYRHGGGHHGIRYGQGWQGDRRGGRCR